MYTNKVCITSLFVCKSDSLVLLSAFSCFSVMFQHELSDSYRFKFYIVETDLLRFATDIN